MRLASLDIIVNLKVQVMLVGNLEVAIMLKTLLIK